MITRRQARGNLERREMPCGKTIGAKKSSEGNKSEKNKKQNTWGRRLRAKNTNIRRGDKGMTWH